MDDFFYVLKDIIHRPADSPPAHFGHDAEGAEVIAAVLDLDVAAGVKGIVGSLKAEKVLFKMLRADRFTIEMSVDNLKNGAFIGIFNKIGHSLHFLQFLPLSVHHATGHDGYRLMVSSRGLVDGFPGLCVPLVGDSAGIDDIDIRIVSIINYLVIMALKLGSQGVGLELVQAAAQGLECYFSV